MLSSQEPFSDPWQGPVRGPRVTSTLFVVRGRGRPNRFRSNKNTIATNSIRSTRRTRRTRHPPSARQVSGRDLAEVKRILYGGETTLVRFSTTPILRYTSNVARDGADLNTNLLLCMIMTLK